MSRRVALSILGTCTASGPVLYPLWLMARTGRLPDPVPPDLPPGGWPSLAVVVPAYREQQVIAEKVADLHANGYPGSLEVIVVADDPATATVARSCAARVLTPDRRRGKSAALNIGIAATVAEVVVLSDANTALSMGALANLARWFHDPRVGAVAGEKRAATEGFYWRFESWLKRREARLGVTIGLVGELCALRRVLFRALPADVAVDDLWLALDIAEQGAAVRYEPSAVATEIGSATLAQVWERRTRVVAGALDVIVRRRQLLTGQPPVTAQLWGHRLLRMTVGPVAHCALLTGALLRVAGARRHPLGALFLAGHALGAFGVLRTAKSRPGTPVEALAGQVLLLQAVGLGGLLRYLRGDRPALWPKPERAAL